MSRSLFLSAAPAALLLAACSGSPAENTTAERPPVAVEVASVSARDVSDAIAVVGTLAPKFQGEVKAEYSGTISEVLVSEWVHVSKGTLLARFDRREPEAALQAAVAARLQAEVGATRAHRELERSEKLKAAGLATQQDLDDARSAAAAAAAQVNATGAQEAMARTRLAKTEVRAPSDGVIAARTVNPGDFIENMGSPQPMFRIVDNRQLELTVSVPSSQIGSVQVGQTLKFETSARSGRTFEGKVRFINPSAEESSRTVKVIAVVDNSDGALKSGFFAKGAIVTGERRGVLAVPRTAMVTWDPASHAGVLYVVSGGRAQKKNVTTGLAAGDDIEVTGGLVAGDVVVTRGAFNLRDGDRIAAAGSTGA